MDYVNELLLSAAGRKHLDGLVYPGNLPGKTSIDAIGVRFNARLEDDVFTRLICINVWEICYHRRRCLTVTLKLIKITKNRTTEQHRNKIID